MRKWLAAVLAASMFTAGCMGGGQQQPQAQPEPSSDQVEKAVSSTLHETDMKDFIRTTVRAQAGSELLELALDTQDGQKLVQDAVKRSLSSSVGQQAITNQVGQMMNDAAFQTQIQLAIRQAIMDMLTKGTGQQGGKGASQQKSKSGGGGGDQGGGGGDSGGGGGGGGGGGS